MEKIYKSKKPGFGFILSETNRESDKKWDNRGLLCDLELESIEDLIESSIERRINGDTFYKNYLTNNFTIKNPIQSFNSLLTKLKVALIRYPSEANSIDYTKFQRILQTNKTYLLVNKEPIVFGDDVNDDEKDDNSMIQIESQINFKEPRFSEREKESIITAASNIMVALAIKHNSVDINTVDNAIKLSIDLNEKVKKL